MSFVRPVHLSDASGHCNQEPLWAREGALGVTHVLAGTGRPQDTPSLPSPCPTIILARASEQEEVALTTEGSTPLQLPQFALDHFG